MEMSFAPEDFFGGAKLVSIERSYRKSWFSSIIQLAWCFVKCKNIHSVCSKIVFISYSVRVVPSEFYAQQNTI